MESSKYVVTITRQFGSLGRPIAKKIAQKLGINYYDRDIVEEAAKKLNLPVSKINEHEESAKKLKRNRYIDMAFPLGIANIARENKSSETQDKIFEAQKNIIQFLAEKETCLIVGRCSDFVLWDMENVMNIYIYASYEARLKNSIEELKLSEDDAKKMIRQVDEAREAYHLNYAGFKPDDPRFKDLMIDSSFLGVDGTADLIADIIKRKYCSE